MRRLFLVLAKLVGLLQLYWALAGFIQIGPIFTMLHAPSGPIQVEQILTNLIGIVLYFALSLGMAWLLLARTEWLADRLKVQDEGGVDGLDKHPMLLVGVKLIGVYVTVLAIPSLARALLNSWQILAGQIGLRVWHGIIPSALQLGIGLFLALKSDKVVEIITKKEETTKQPTPPNSENCGGSSRQE
jgi:hypothetical protein